ncbi:hypothetical protein [Pseudomonas nitroreducens]|uniref:Uncharacterized protein n=1 Tax=Pseudomonas nitroreducens TaxID=46680 RepID=A0A2D0ADX1_PSENT|nr:hypothetical protein [Pseudomonas nitroreducens]OWP50273.1 hypothetical protein CEG18_12020 [Pseudomonas nitroreducens]
MAVTIYTHHDAAGPGLNLTGTNLDRLKQILIPCLVNGYAGKPAAGWTLAQSITNGLTLARPSGAAVNFTRTTVWGFMVYLMESMTSGAASPPTGQNLRSQAYSASSNPSDTNRHWVSFRESDTVRGWFVAATADAFILCIRWGEAVADTALASSLVFFCGAAKLHSGLTGVQNMFALGGEIRAVSYTSSTQNNQLEGGATLLRDPLTGAAISGAGLTASGGPSMLQQFATFYTPMPPALPPSLRLNPLHIGYGTSFVGYVPGILYDNIIGHYEAAGIMAAMGFTPTLEAWKAPKVVNGYSVWPIPCPYGLLFLTDDPGAW